MTIKTKLQNPWRDRYQPAAFRNAQFFVETDARVGGRRVAVHEYPKRNTPYAEDMGRKALRFLVQGYLIGPHYWEQKNRLIAELDKDGPGLLRLPLPYNMADVKVTVDHPDHVAPIARAAREAGVEVGVLVDVDLGMRRCGVASPEAAVALIGSTVDETALERLAAAASAACRPIDDKRGTKAFRIKVAGVLARRAAETALQRAGGK